jgi:hypothetical protein
VKYIRLQGIAFIKYSQHRSGEKQKMIKIDTANLALREMRES